MFARITTIVFRSDQLDEAIGLYESSVVGAARKQQGFRGASLLSDREKGKIISITLWESETDALANERSGYYQEQVNKFKGLWIEPPVREGYQVSVQA